MEFNPSGMRLGFLGTGTITEAVVTGLCKTRFRGATIVVSPRSDKVAGRLAAAHDNVSIGSSNQDVLDRSDIVFMAVRPQIIEDVIGALEFRPDHHVISFVAAVALDRLWELIVQPVRLSQALPLPFVADLQGATAIHPADEVAEAVFSALGTAVQVESKLHFDLLTTMSALMGTYFGVLDAASGWAESRGLPRAASDAYLRQLFSGLAHVATAKPTTSFIELVSEHSTKGGLNEQVLADYEKLGGMDALQKAFDGVLARLRPGETSVLQRV